MPNLSPLVGLAGGMSQGLLQKAMMDYQAQQAEKDRQTKLYMAMLPYMQRRDPQINLSQLATLGKSLQTAEGGPVSLQDIYGLAQDPSKIGTSGFKFRDRPSLSPPTGKDPKLWAQALQQANENLKNSLTFYTDPNERMADLIDQANMIYPEIEKLYRGGKKDRRIPRGKESTTPAAPGIPTPYSNK